MLLQDDQGFPDRQLALRARGPLGARCAESQADGVPCPNPDCDCDECVRAFARTPLEHPRPARPLHA